jgi:signal peptidase I
MYLALTTILKSIREWMIYLVISLIIMLLIGIFVFQSTKVVGLSMYPTLKDSQIVYVLKLNHTFGLTPDYEDIVIVDSRLERDRTFKDEFLDSPLGQLFYESTDHHLWIKRVIGKPGDEIMIKEGHVIRNGTRLEESYINDVMFTSGETIWIIPEDYVFVMGDNRNHSKDSREIGIVPVSHILGRKL